MPEIREIIEKADVVDLKSRTKDEVLRELADLLAKRPEITDPDDFVRCIFEREKLISTGIGIGLAMPHVKIPSVKDFVLAIGRPSRGVDFDSLDGHPVHIVAMIGASDRQSGEFLKVLAKLVLRLKNKYIRQKVLLTPDAAEVKRILIEADADAE
jgi:mannitol/fructose-specific phosphotransferase system IIA component (Ntr-type)